MLVTIIVVELVWLAIALARNDRAMATTVLGISAVLGFLMFLMWFVSGQTPSFSMVALVAFSIANVFAWLLSRKG